MNTNTDFAVPYGALGDVAFATYLYYREAQKVVATAADFAAWLATLPITQRTHAEARGLAAARSVPEFKRFLLEARGHLLTELYGGPAIAHGVCLLAGPARRTLSGGGRCKYTTSLTPLLATSSSPSIPSWQRTKWGKTAHLLAMRRYWQQTAGRYL
ncbi:hypothetical protein [Hymenobacter terrenus]|uniref:hypothetical protein n=1 Tax=Hymenobacter terrenus TaxID=1629124 RepID=UPI000619E9F6|nr:hypothetical protein [Hymenobacter terrenus]